MLQITEREPDVGAKITEPKHLYLLILATKSDS
jgi:hypothetical protein